MADRFKSIESNGGKNRMRMRALISSRMLNDSDKKSLRRVYLTHSNDPFTHTHTHTGSRLDFLFTVRCPFARCAMSWLFAFAMETSCCHCCMVEYELPLLLFNARNENHKICFIHTVHTVHTHTHYIHFYFSRALNCMQSYVVDVDAPTKLESCPVVKNDARNKIENAQTMRCSYVAHPYHYA